MLGMKENRANKQKSVTFRLKLKVATALWNGSGEGKTNWMYLIPGNSLDKKHLKKSFT